MGRTKRSPAGAGPGGALGAEVYTEDKAGPDPSENDLVYVWVSEIELASLVDIKS
jgi:hypothetical protein